MFNSDYHHHSQSSAIRFKNGCRRTICKPSQRLSFLGLLLSLIGLRIKQVRCANAAGAADPFRLESPPHVAWVEGQLLPITSSLLKGEKSSGNATTCHFAVTFRLAKYHLGAIRGCMCGGRNTWGFSRARTKFAFASVLIFFTAVVSLQSMWSENVKVIKRTKAFASTYTKLFIQRPSSGSVMSPLDAAVLGHYLDWLFGWRL